MMTTSQQGRLINCIRWLVVHNFALFALSANWVVTITPVHYKVVGSEIELGMANLSAVVSSIRCSFYVHTELSSRLPVLECMFEPEDLLNTYISIQGTTVNGTYYDWWY